MQFNHRRISLAINTALVLSGAGVGFAGNAIAESAKQMEEIVVTGSMIRNPNLERSAPVNVIASEEMEFQAVAQVEEILREIPGSVQALVPMSITAMGGFPTSICEDLAPTATLYWLMVGALRRRN